MILVCMCTRKNICMTKLRIFFTPGIKQSKTDPFHKGTDLYVGHTLAVLCLVAALWSFFKKGAGLDLLFCF